MQRKKILYFDYWTVGIRNFKLFDEHLKARGYETKLLHLIRMDAEDIIPVESECAIEVVNDGALEVVKPSFIL